MYSEEKARGPSLGAGSSLAKNSILRSSGHLISFASQRRKKTKWPGGSEGTEREKARKRERESPVGERCG